MTAYAASQRTCLFHTLRTGDHPDGDDTALEALIRDALVAARANGRLTIPKAVFEHGMRLGTAFKRFLSNGTMDRDVDEAISWMARAHRMDISMVASRMKRAQPHVAPESLLGDLIAWGETALADGRFGNEFVQDSDLVRSAWTGEGHQLSFNGWTPTIKAHANGSMYIGTILRPLARVHAPKSFEVEMRLRTGRLVIGSDAPLPDLRATCIANRQKADMAASGRQGEIALTNSLINTHGAIAIPVHDRTLHMLSNGTRLDVVTKDNPDRRLAHEVGSVLLDYRHLFVADEAALAESLRATYADTQDVLLDRMAKAWKADGLSFVRVQVEPGRYRITLPGGFSNRLPHDPTSLGGRNPAILRMERIATT